MYNRIEHQFQRPKESLHRCHMILFHRKLGTSDQYHRSPLSLLEPRSRLRNERFHLLACVAYGHCSFAQVEDNGRLISKALAGGNLLLEPREPSGFGGHGAVLAHRALVHRGRS